MLKARTCYLIILGLLLALPLRAVASDLHAAPPASKLPIAARPSVSGAFVRDLDDTEALYPLVVDPLELLARLSASDGAPNDQLGWSAAISGNTVVITAPFWNLTQGSAYVFVKPAGGWTKMTETAELTASDAALNGNYFGESVAIDGDVIVVGALNLPIIGASIHNRRPPFNPVPGAYVFVKPKSGWKSMTETAKLTASDAQQFDYFGNSVSISGNTVVVGTPQIGLNSSTGPGKAYVYVKPARGWKSATETARLTASDGVLDDWGGNSVSISGKTVVSGAPQHKLGAAYVFVKPASGWKNMTQTAELTTSDKLAGGLGSSVAIFGNTVVSGAPYVPFGQRPVGAAYVFVEPPGGWADGTETAKLTIPHFPFTYNFGFSVDIKGNMIAAGAPAWPIGSGLGSAYLFLKPASGWKTTSKFKAKLLPSDSALDDRFGFSIRISNGTVAVGSSVDGGTPQSRGAGYVFGP